MTVLQVPQFILEDAWYRGKGCRVVCTQPRRISAISGAPLLRASAAELRPVQHPAADRAS
jgi:HrpA-like RNA helicase